MIESKLKAKNCNRGRLFRQQHFRLRSFASLSFWSMAAVAQLRRRRRRRRRAYAPTSNTASHDNHEKIKSWVSFFFLHEYRAPLKFEVCD